MAKAVASKMVLSVLDRGIQICGALGYSGDLPLEQWYRLNRFGPIGDGPDEIHKVVVARDTLKGIEPVEGWPTDHIPSRKQEGLEKFASLHREASRA
jgi:acyl-CoA dehydrogenase